MKKRPSTSSSSDDEISKKRDVSSTLDTKKPIKRDASSSPETTKRKRAVSPSPETLAKKKTSRNVSLSPDKKNSDEKVVSKKRDVSSSPETTRRTIANKTLDSSNEKPVKRDASSSPDGVKAKKDDAAKKKRIYRNDRSKKAAKKSDDDSTDSEFDEIEKKLRTGRSRISKSKSPVDPPKKKVSRSSSSSWSLSPDAKKPPQPKKKTKNSSSSDSDSSQSEVDKSKKRQESPAISKKKSPEQTNKKPPSRATSVEKLNRKRARKSSSPEPEDKKDERAKSPKKEERSKSRKSPETKRGRSPDEKKSKTDSLKDDSSSRSKTNDSKINSKIKDDKKKDSTRSRDDDKSRSRDDDKSRSRDDDKLKSRNEVKSKSRDDDKSKSRDDDKSRSRDDDKLKSRDDEKLKSRDDDKSKSRVDDKSKSRDEIKSKSRDDDKSRSRTDDGKSKSRDDDKSKSRTDDKSTKSREDDKSRSRNDKSKSLKDDDKHKSRTDRLKSPEQSRSSPHRDRKKDEASSPRRDRKKDEDKKRGDKDDKDRKKKDEKKDNSKTSEIVGDLESEMKKRKERIEAWRKARKKEDGSVDDAEAEVKKEEEEADEKKKGWSLEDDDEEEEEPVPNGTDKEAEEAENGEAVVKEENGEEKGPAEGKVDVKMEEAEVKADVKMETEDDEEVDPLEAFMKGIQKEIKAIQPAIKTAPDGAGTKTVSVVKTVVVKKEAKQEVAKPEVMEQNQDALEYSSEEEKKDELDVKDVVMMGGKKKKELSVVDHDMVHYAAFRKSFYMEVPELSRMTIEELIEVREKHFMTVRGKNVPKPIRNWSQTGVSVKCLDVIKKNGYETPTPIQAQAIPTVMSGRDVIGIAKTGSGKTLAFVLPMLRHIMDQSPLDEEDGPIGIIMTPTRELALQIFREVKKFSKLLKLRPACIYGGSGISEQIAELKRGAEIIVCTPGRMIDMLTVNNGRVTNCRRCTYLVLDEADRMFDMGFEPQVMRIIDNIRPDRQTVLFSATFPRQMEALARRILTKPVEIMVGGRSVVCADIEQNALVIDIDNRFFKLLELLGIYQEKGGVLVFVEKQDSADNLFKDLLKQGYPCLSLHGGMDQFDRDSTIADFKNGVTKLMVSTSVAARGLDVKNLMLVVNYDAPNHYEDYVHRVGRTGRAGNKGTAFTFLTYEQGALAGSIIQAFKQTGNEPPADVLALWNGYKEEMEKDGKKVKINSGFSGKGFKFNDDEVKDGADAKKMQKFALGLQDSDDEAEAAENAMEKIEADLEKTFANKPKVAMPKELLEQQKAKTEAAAEAGTAVAQSKLKLVADLAGAINKKISMGQVVDRNTTATSNIMAGVAIEKLGGIGLAKQLADKVNAKLNYKAEEVKTEEVKPVMQRYEDEIDINDFPQQARWKITSKEVIENVRELAEVGITIRGIHLPPNAPNPEDERRLHIYIESLSEMNIQIAKAEIKRLLKEELIRHESHSYRPSTGRYKVLQ